MNLIAETKNRISKGVEELNALASLETPENPLTEQQEEAFEEKKKEVEAFRRKLARLEQIKLLDIKKAKKASRKDDDEDEDGEETSEDDDRDEEDEDKRASKETDEEDDDSDRDDKKGGKKSVWANQKKSVWGQPARSNVVIRSARPRGEAKGTRAARFIIGKAIAKTFGDNYAGAQWARDDMGDKEVSKALNTLTQISGGALIPQDFLPDLVELLYSDTVIRANGAPVIPMPFGNLTIPRMAAGANAYWIGELDPIPVSQQKFSDLQLFAKKLVAMTPTSMDMVRRSPFSVEQLVLNDLREQIGLKEDLAYLLSPGTDAAVPYGLPALAATANVFNYGALPTATGSNQAQILQAVAYLFQFMLLTLQSQNVSTASAKWIMSYSVYAYLSSLLNTFGGNVYFLNGEMTLLGLPVLLTNLLPTNLSVTRSGTTTTDNTQIFLVNFNDLIIGDTMNLLTDSSNVASYESGGTVTSSYQNDQMLFRTIKEVDFNVRRPQSIVCATVTGFEPAGWTGNAGLVYTAAPVNTTPSYAGSANPVTTSPTVAANTAAVVAANTAAEGAPGGTITPNSSGQAYEGS